MLLQKHGGHQPVCFHPGSPVSNWLYFELKKKNLCNVSTISCVDTANDADRANNTNIINSAKRGMWLIPEGKLAGVSTVLGQDGVTTSDLRMSGFHQPWMVCSAVN